ncbi:MAG TPA: EAL domain-containing protein [Ideonella sp.]|nr:EAL domain-containing protein [Ideonella sp.]
MMNHLVPPDRQAVHDGRKSRQRILIVDDEARMRSSLTRLLTRPNRDIVEVDSGAAAKELLLQETMSLVLLDIGLPDVSGLDMLRWISQQHPDTPVIMVSGDVRIDSAIRALRYGAVEFVRKPEELDAIAVKVDAALERRRLRDEHRLMTSQLAQSERLHRFLVDNSPDIVYALDEQGHFAFVNPRVETLLGYSREELIGQPFAAIVHELDRSLARQLMMRRPAEDRDLANVEVRLLRKRDDKGPRPYVVTMVSAVGIFGDEEAAAVSAGPRYLGSYGVARDITERKRAEEMITFQALHDQLTGLPNRRLFKDHLELALAQASRRGEKVGVMFIDLDRFKLVNDTYGHFEGDELLKNFAQRLRGCIRAGDTVARQGGDEFTVLLPDLNQAEDAMIIANKLFAELQRPFMVGGREFIATASIGISVYPNDGDSADVLLRHADIAMYEVKASGKNGGRLFTADMKAGHLPRLELERDLRNAIPNGEFVLHFQPQFSLRQGRVIGAEGLIRWEHPEHGLLSPGSFIELAEETGLIGSISDWVVEEACGQLARWHREGHAGLRMAVNLSPREFSRADLVERVSSSLSRHKLPRDVFEVEITENVLLQDVPGVIDKLKQLRELGVRISIDDFGTRYSSLNYLRRFPINSIKIDQSFVRDIVGGERVSPIIHAIVGIARGFDLHLVAEGVETELQRQVLAELGCDEMQGYLFAAPTTANAVSPMLLAHRQVIQTAA